MQLRGLRLKPMQDSWRYQEKMEMAKQKQAQEDELFQLKKQQLEQSLKPETPEFDMDGFSSDLSQFINIIETSPNMAKSISGRLAAKYPFLKDDLISIANDPQSALPGLKELQGRMTKTEEMKVGRYRTERVGDRIIMYDSASGQEVEGWDVPAQLSSGMEKRMLTAIDKAYESDRTLARLSDLANEMEKVDISGGIQSTGAEWLKEFTGNQDIVSELRMDLRGIRNSQVVKNLPPGVASDKDIEMALKGFPADNAPAHVWLRFMRGQAKLAAMDSSFNNFQADWISERKKPQDMMKAWREKVSEDNYLSELFSSNIEDFEQEPRQEQQPKRTELSPDDKAGYDALPNGAIYYVNGIRYKKGQ